MFSHFNRSSISLKIINGRKLSMNELKNITIGITISLYQSIVLVQVGRQWKIAFFFNSLLQFNEILRRHFLVIMRLVQGRMTIYVFLLQRNQVEERISFHFDYLFKLVRTSTRDVGTITDVLPKKPIRPLSISGNEKILPYLISRLLFISNRNSGAWSIWKKRKNSPGFHNWLAKREKKQKSSSFIAFFFLQWQIQVVLVIPSLNDHCNIHRMVIDLAWSFSFFFDLLDQNAWMMLVNVFSRHRWWWWE